MIKSLRLADRLIKLEASIKASEDNIRSCREYIEKATAELPVLQREFDKKCSRNLVLLAENGRILSQQH